MTDNLFTRFSAPALHRNKVFLAPPGRKTVTFAQAFGQAGRYAHVLAAHGAKKGDRIAVQVEKSAENIFLYLACLRAGLVYLPLNTGYTASELRYFIGDAEPAIFVCAPRDQGMLAGIFPNGTVLTLGDDGKCGSLLEEAAGQSPDFPDAVLGKDDLASILYTSGTTGVSKGAMLTHGNLWSNAEVLRREWRFSHDDVLLHALPIFHIHGLFVAINICLAARASIILLPKFDIEEIFRKLAAATVMMGVPTFYVRLLQDPRLNSETAGHMRLFVSGSAPLLAETHREWSARTGQAILERYGMTETNINTSNPYEGARKPGSVGMPLSGTELRIADGDGKPLPQGEIGMIEVKGPNVFAGYWRMPEKTAAEFRADGFFITGDLGMIDDDGYVHIVGRAKDLIISGGFNVYPKEIESLIDELPDVAESAVIGLPHRDFGEGVTAVVVLNKGAAMTQDQVMAALKDRLARFKQPKAVLFTDQFPRNTMGKVQKKLLRDQYKDLYA
ncbi:MAG: malonyl-CoA synthase [Alphaproteobacteria bacterium]|nr:malonyl-CoA synthase [Alphaproteobacteria bacterium]